MKEIRILLVLLALAGLWGCDSSNQPEPEKPVTQPEKPLPPVVVPMFNADSAYAFTQKQVDFGPRVPETPAHDSTLAWLHAKLSGFADTVYLQSDKATVYNGQKKRFTNIIASFNPNAGKRIMLCAHWDTRPFADQDENPANWKTPIDGANDGASGVAILIELARLLKDHPVDIGVDLILFDLEDYGEPKFDARGRPDTYALGSQYWSRHPHVSGYTAKYGILMDMVGAKGSTFRMEEYSMRFAPDVMKRVWKVAGDLGYSGFFMYTPAQPIQDDHFYVNTIMGLPTIDIIHLNNAGQHLFHHSWHTMDDNMEVIDVNTLRAVGQTVTKVVYLENAGQF